MGFRMDTRSIIRTTTPSSWTRGALWPSHTTTARRTIPPCCTSTAPWSIRSLERASKRQIPTPSSRCGSAIMRAIRSEPLMASSTKFTSQTRRARRAGSTPNTTTKCGPTKPFTGPMVSTRWAQSNSKDLTPSDSTLLSVGAIPINSPL